MLRLSHICRGPLARADSVSLRSFQIWCRAGDCLFGEDGLPVIHGIVTVCMYTMYRRKIPRPPLHLHAMSLAYPLILALTSDTEPTLRLFSSRIIALPHSCSPDSSPLPKLLSSLPPALLQTAPDHSVPSHHSRKSRRIFPPSHSTPSGEETTILPFHPSPPSQTSQ